MLTLFSVVAIVVGYCFSILRYNENVNPIAVIGSILMIAGLFIVVLSK
jgi:multidrug transporter EmrE-like cation transporter